MYETNVNKDVNNSATQPPFSRRKVMSLLHAYHKDNARAIPGNLGLKIRLFTMY